MDIRLVKVCSMGLQSNLLMQKFHLIADKLMGLKTQMNILGEGGEYESTTLNAECFFKTIDIDVDVNIPSSQNQNKLFNLVCHDVKNEV